eukprot:1393143-Amorphochlora_amoeboformis.AAC.1
MAHPDSILARCGDVNDGTISAYRKEIYWIPRIIFWIPTLSLLYVTQDCLLHIILNSLTYQNKICWIPKFTFGSRECLSPESQRMRIVGLTGGIACGKSTVVKAIERCGVPVIDCDKIARQVVTPGSPGLRDIVKHFGNDVLRVRNWGVRE